MLFFFDFFGLLILFLVYFDDLNGDEFLYDWPVSHHVRHELNVGESVLLILLVIICDDIRMLPVFHNTCPDIHRPHLLQPDRHPAPHKLLRLRLGVIQSDPAFESDLLKLPLLPMLPDPASQLDLLNVDGL